MNGKGRILIVEDHRSMRETLEIFFQRQGWHVTTCSGGVEAFDRLLADAPFEIVITDLVMPEVDGIEVLKEVKKRDSTTQVVVITAFAKTEDAVRAMRLGAYDYIQKPFSMEELLQTAENAVEKCRLLRENIRLRKTVSGKYQFANIIGESEPLRQVIETCNKVRDLPSNVLITGESGTGKELIARALHFSGPRAARPFVTIDCGAIPENLMESELFGHVKGSFTGATSSHEGLLRAADGGTIFFDEVGELPSGLQIKLLRVLQERLVKPVGGVEELPVDVRVIAATSRNIETEVEEGKFRKELYFRINVIRINMPPLRRRKEDIPLLAEYFMKRFNSEFGKSISGFTPEAVDFMTSCPFPGNVRELSNVIERTVALEAGERITLETLREGLEMGKMLKADDEKQMGDVARDVERYGIDAYLGLCEERVLRRFLQLYGGDRSMIARKLGITVRSLRYRLGKYGLVSQSDDDTWGDES
jgi:two-component system response regulator PilR (NtrC family)